MMQNNVNIELYPESWVTAEDPLHVFQFLRFRCFDQKFCVLLAGHDPDDPNGFMHRASFVGHQQEPQEIIDAVEDAKLSGYVCLNDLEDSYDNILAELDEANSDLEALQRDVDARQFDELMGLMEDALNPYFRTAKEVAGLLSEFLVTNGAPRESPWQNEDFIAYVRKNNPFLHSLLMTDDDAMATVQKWAQWRQTSQE